MTLFEKRAWLVVEADNLVLAERIFSQADGSSLVGEENGQKYVIELAVEDLSAVAAD